MHKIFKKLVLITCLITCMIFPQATSADSSYEAYIQDDADLLSSEEEAKLQVQLADIACNYGNACFVSISTNSTDADTYARSYIRNRYGEYTSSIIVLVDMDNRKIQIAAKGSISEIITSSYCNTITDNVYTYLTDKEYYTGVSKAFDQIYTLLEGGKISQPMKYICNALIGLLLGCIICYLIVRATSKRRQATEKEQLKAIFSNVKIDNPIAQFTHQTKVYNPPSSSSGGGSGGGGGGGGGGGSSGGHSF